MTDTNEHTRLIAALINMFASASVTAGAVAPQACALLLSSGQIAGGVAMNPVTIDNPEAEDAIQMAAQTAKGLPGLNSDFKIVAMAMTTSSDASGQPAQLDISLYEQSLWELTNLETDNLLLVEPNTQQTTKSETFPEYGFAS